MWTEARQGASLKVCRFPRKRSFNENPRKGMGSWDFLPARPSLCFGREPRHHLSIFHLSRHRFTLRLRHGRITSSGVGRRRPAAPRTGLRHAAVRQSFGATTRRDLDMGAIAEGLVAYAQPLLDQTDGSEEQLNVSPLSRRALGFDTPREFVAAG